MTAFFSRAHLLSRSVKGGGALVIGGTALGRFVETAAADSLPPTDLAYARLLVAGELLASDFYTQAIAAGNSDPSVMKLLKRAYTNEQEHYQSVAGILSGAGQTPAVSGDIDFSYPTGTFDDQASILELAKSLEATLLGAYLGALGGMQTTALKTGLGHIAACEAQHSSYFTTATGGKPFNLSFPPALTIGEASDAFDAFTA